MPESTDGQDDELNDRQNTEQETKLVKNRNTITTKRTELKDEVHCLAKASQKCRMPNSQMLDGPPFC